MPKLYLFVWFQKERKGKIDPTNIDVHMPYKMLQQTFSGEAIDQPDLSNWDQAEPLAALPPMPAEPHSELPPMPSSPETSGPSSDESLDAYVEQAVERVLYVDDLAEADDIVLMD